MSRSPIQQVEKVPAGTRARVAVKRLVSAYMDNPLRSAFHLNLVFALFLLALGRSVGWQGYVILALLALTQLHAWYVKEGYLSPLAGLIKKKKKK